MVVKGIGIELVENGYVVSVEELDEADSYVLRQYIYHKGSCISESNEASRRNREG